ncbi:MAG TPA: RNA methyltransferase [Polyangiaceae bacterium]|nr:RNA methyltransferase [Polyangiaceae bacterium]HMR79324.1 RNA methyltransferase [Polyangiaceae bacterium]
MRPIRRLGPLMYKQIVEPKPKLRLNIHACTTFVLVRPHYPENVGAAARAIKTMGFTSLCLVKPGKIAVPDHPMAQKMAVKSRDVLDAAQVCARLEDALAGADCVVVTTSRNGVSGATGPRQIGQALARRAARGERVAILFGNEKTGLSAELVDSADYRLRIPMAGDQPSVNLAQATQLVAYELLMAALELRESDPTV